MLDPATARLCVWRLPLEAAFRLFSKLGSLGGSIRERFSRTGRTRPALARPAFSRWLLENDRLRERWPCQWLNVLYFPFSETSPITTASPLPLVQYGAWGSRFELKSSSCLACMLTRIVATIRLCCRCFGGDNFEALRKHQIPRKPKCVNTWVFVILARSHFFCA